MADGTVRHGAADLWPYRRQVIGLVAIERKLGSREGGRCLSLMKAQTRELARQLDYGSGGYSRHMILRAMNIALQNQGLPSLRFTQASPGSWAP